MDPKIESQNEQEVINKATEVLNKLEKNDGNMKKSIILLDNLL